MNRLIATLTDKNQLTVGALRRLYRRLAVRSHPDAPHGSEAAFVRLQEEYDEALGWLLSREADRAKQRCRGGDAREQFLRMLYLYAVGYGSKNWRKFLAELIEVAFEYSDVAGKLFADYHDAVVPALNKKDYLTYLHHAHRILLSSISTLAWLFENDSTFDRRLLKSYLDDLSERGKKLEGKVGSVLLRMSQLLEKEAEGGRVSLVTIEKTDSMRRGR